MKKTLYIIFFLLVAGTAFAQNYPRPCTEEDIPSSARSDYYNTVERYLNIYYQMLPISIGSAENRAAIISNVMANPDGVTLKTEFLLNPVKNPTFVSPNQYYVKFENEFGQMADEVEFIVDNCKHGDIMMNSLVSCYIPVDYDLTAKKGDEVLFKRRCRMTFFFQRVSISSIAKTMQVEPLKDIIAYKPQGNQVVSSRKKIAVSMSDMSKTYEQAVEWYNQGLKDKYMPVFKQLAEQGYTDAQWHYGYCLGEDSITLGESIQWLQKAVDKNHPRALNSLGYWYRMGKGVSKDVEKAFELFKRSAEAGWGKGACNLALAYEKGEGCQQDFAAAEKWYVKAAELGFPAAYGDCAVMYWDKNTEKAREYLLKGVEKKAISCFALLALCYHDGILQFPQNKDAAAEYYKTVLDYKLQDKDKTYNDEWYDRIEKYYQEVKPWYDSKPENLLARLAMDKRNPYIAKVKAYKEKKKYKDKYDKAMEIRYSNVPKAISELTKLAEEGMPEALAYMGNYWSRNNQYAKAYNMLAAAALNNTNADAFNGLADCYYYEHNVEQDLTQAVRLYEHAANINPMKTRFELGYCYYYGVGVEKSGKLAFQYLRESTNNGSFEAAAYLGLCYANGIGVDRDTIQAAKWLKKSADKGVPVGMYGWGYYIYNGITTKKDVKLGVDFFTKAANCGHIASMVCLGKHYYDEKQYQQSLQWYEKAAGQGDAEAQFYTALLYSNKKEPSNAKDIAKSWYTKAAGQNHIRAMAQLAWILHNEGTPEGKKQAFEWWHKAAEGGNVTSQYNLALCYENAWGTTRSKANAVPWYIKAAQKNYKEAVERVEELKKQYKSSRIPTPSKKGDYSGTVYVLDKPAKDVFVYIPGTDIITITNNEGKFFLRGVKNSKDVRVIHASGKSIQWTIKGYLL